MKIRCSQLPTFMSCPSSLEECANPINSPSEAADLGTAVHKALEVLAKGGIPDLQEIALAHHVEHEEVARLYGYGAKAWLELTEAFDSSLPVSEIEVHAQISDDVVITGHPDIVLKAVGADWKTGRVRTDAKWQMEGYARLTGVRLWYVVWLRDMATDEVECMEPEAFDRAVLAQVEKIGKEYNPGHQCYYCQRREVCEARNIHLRQSLALFKPARDAEITRSDMAKAYPYLAQVERACRDFRALLKADVAENGPLDLGDGKELASVSSSEDHIDPQAGWPVLDKYLGTDMSKAVRIVKGSAKEVIFSNAEKGQKQKTFEAMMADLRARGAVVKVEKTSLRARKKG